MYTFSFSSSSCSNFIRIHRFSTLFIDLERRFIATNRELLAQIWLMNEERKLPQFNFPSRSQGQQACGGNLKAKVLSKASSDSITANDSNHRWNPVEMSSVDISLGAGKVQALNVIFD
jgi:hypothetical protein